MRNSAVISIGNEILLGRTLNTNLAWLAGELALLGLPVEFSVTVKDEPQAIREALKLCWDKYDLVITTGGLGPTGDDITKQEIASFFGAKLVFDPSIWQHVQNIFSARKLVTPEINRNQAMVPENFSPLTNLRGTAPGLFRESNGKCFVALAGVPLEMKHVFTTQVRKRLQDMYGTTDAIYQTTLHSYGIPESALAERLAEFRVPDEISLAWLPQTGRVDLRFYGNSESLVRDTAESCIPKLGKNYWGRDDDTPASVLLALLTSHGLSLSIAESCTGGLAQKMCTDVPGSSAAFKGGVVAYSNAIKSSLLRVQDETLSRYGAVSEECAREMAHGIKVLTDSLAAISITGVAGPDGGSSDKPVGTVCFGFSYLCDEWSMTQIFNGDRESIRYKASEFALLEMFKLIQGKVL